MQQPNARNANAAPSGPRDGVAEQISETIKPSIITKPRCSDQVVAIIEKSHSTQLRVLTTEWRGQRNIELANFTSVVSGIYFQASAGITLDIEKLPELIVALKAVRA